MGQIMNIWHTLVCTFKPARLCIVFFVNFIDPQSTFREEACYFLSICPGVNLRRQTILPFLRKGQNFYVCKVQLAVKRGAQKKNEKFVRKLISKGLFTLKTVQKSRLLHTKNQTRLKSLSVYKAAQLWQFKEIASSSHVLTNPESTLLFFHEILF